VQEHLDLGQDGQGDLGRFPSPQVESDGTVKATKLVFREPLIPQMFQNGPDLSLTPDHAQISGRCWQQLSQGLFRINSVIEIYILKQGLFTEARRGFSASPGRENPGVLRVRLGARPTSWPIR